MKYYFLFLSFIMSTSIFASGTRNQRRAVSPSLAQLAVVAARLQNRPDTPITTHRPARAKDSSTTQQSHAHSANPAPASTAQQPPVAQSSDSRKTYNPRSPSQLERARAVAARMLENPDQRVRPQSARSMRPCNDNPCVKIVHQDAIRRSSRV